MLMDHNAVTPVRIEPVVLPSPVKQFYHCAPIKKVKNNLDPGQATMVVFSDTMYTCRDTQEGGGGLITFSHI